MNYFTNLIQLQQMPTKNQPKIPHRITSDISALLNANPKLKSIWQSLTPIAKNEWICYVTIPKKSETRQKHLERLKEDLLKGKRRPCCWPGCPHRRPKAEKWFGK